MKKNVIVAAVALTALFVGCKDKSNPNPLNCGANAEKVTKAAVAFGNEPSVANCEAYKKEVVAFIKSCPTFYSGVTKQELEEIANMPCDAPEVD
ncbi:hypothetical protein GCM10023091_17230 [Ravibacter arvi]|uniref:Lipoprotein n=1 Tax=Ravibacter arvi TaxID=2051041 RepID=A0ABP8LWU1_9BACT